MAFRRICLPILVAAFAAAGCSTIEDAIMRDQLWKQLVGPSGEPLYREWELFPGTASLTRLGLPVHGRWTTVYVDPINALPFLKRALGTDPEQPFELPAGSIIVKENYRPSQGEAFDSLNADLAVLTVMYKPTGEEVPSGSFYSYYCATRELEPYNGDPETGCLGGRWFYAFYKVVESNGLVRLESVDDSLELGERVFGAWVDDNVNANVGSFCVHCHASAFDTDYLRILDRELNPHMVAPTPPVWPSPVSPPPCELQPQPEPPADVPTNPLAAWASSPEEAKSMFDCFSWQTFVALSWPADSTQPGQPDRGKSLQDIGSGPTVWETYTPVYNLFQAGDTSWTAPPFGSTPQIVAPSCENPRGLTILTLRSKARDVLNETGQAFAGTFGNLIDRNGNEVWYEVFANEVEYDYIVNNGLASTSRLTPSGPSNFTVDLPYNQQSPENSIEVKSAWKEMCTTSGCQPVDDPARYYTREVLRYDAETNSCSGPVQAGLIGLHLAIKTFWAPQWVWATFSHALNVPIAGTSGMQADSFSFFEPGLAPPAPPQPPCESDPFLISLAGCPNVVINRFGNRPTADSFPPLSWLPPADHPNQITRLAPPPPEVDLLNSQFQAAVAGTPFENYNLLNTQWPLNGQSGTRSDPMPHMNACEGNAQGANCFQSVPRYLRNPVIESYMTTYIRENGQARQISNRGCLSCHMGGANGSFFWLDAVGVRVPVSN